MVAEVQRVLGRPRGIRIGEAPDRDGQYFHYLAMWLYALGRLGRIKPVYRDRALELVRQIHPRFVRPGTGVWWKMTEDLSAPYPGYGLGGLDHFHGYVVYRHPGRRGVGRRDRRDAGFGGAELSVHDDGPGLGNRNDALVHATFFPMSPGPSSSGNAASTPWRPCGSTRRATFAAIRACRHVKFAFTNYGVSLGLQAVGAQPDRVQRLHDFFRTYQSGDEYDTEAITHVMACTAWFPGEFIVGGRG